MADDEVVTATIAQASGLDPPTVTAMTLAHYDQRAVRINQRRQVNRWVLWGRASGSRFCPDCLRETEGRWALTWRLGWLFACPRHGRLLADCCPSCGRVARQRPRSGWVIPLSGSCGDPPAGGGSPSGGCGFDLMQTSTPRLPAGHPALTAQERLLETIQSNTADFGVYTAYPQPTQDALADIRAVGGRVLADLPAAMIADLVPPDLVGGHLNPEPGSRLAELATDRPGFMAPPRAVSAAVAVIIALRVLHQPDIHRGRAGDAAAAGGHARGTLAGQRHQHRRLGARREPGPEIRAAGGSRAVAAAQRTDPLPHGRRRAQPPKHDQPRGHAASPEDPQHVLASLDGPAHPNRRGLSPRSRAGAGRLAADRRHPDQPPGRRRPPRWGHRRHQRLPPPATTGRPAGVAGHDHRPGPAGRSPRQHRRPDRLPASSPPGLHRSATTRTLASGLPRHRQPAGHRPPRADRPLPTLRPPQRSARRRVRPRLPSDNPAQFRAEAARFPLFQTPELAAEARVFLAGHRIRSEPLTWQPPAVLLDGLDLAGPDLEQIDLPRLHQLVRGRRSPVERAAEVFGISVEAIRLVLVEHPAPALPPSRATARATGQNRFQARQQLPKDTFARLYLDEHRSLRQIAEQTGCSRQTLTRLANEYDIPLKSRH